MTPTENSGYRSSSQSEARGARAGGPGEVTEALRALAPLVADTRALDGAYLALAGSRGVTCGACGRLTRHVGTRRHVRCA